MPGYPRLLSGDLRTVNVDREAFIKKHQAILFPETPVATSWTNIDRAKRYYLSFPQYPFRTLCPRDMNMLNAKQNDFDGNSPLFPAHTQINFLFRKRRNVNFLNFMLPFSLPHGLGSTAKTLTLEQKVQATTFTVRTPAVAARPAVVAAEGVQARAAVPAVAAFDTNYRINRVTINVQDMYLQVYYNAFFFFKKNFLTFFFNGLGYSLKIQGSITRTSAQ